MRSATDPDHGYHDSRTPPAARLVFAILSQAIQDLFGSPGSNLTARQSSAARRDALDFLTASWGSAAHWRKTYCDLVGMDAEVLRSRIVAILEGGEMPPLAYGVGKNPAGLADARAMWAAQRPRPGSPMRVPRIIPKAPPPPLTPVKTRTEHKYEDVRHLVYELLKTPHSYRDLVIATNGDIGEHQIRRALREGLEARLLSRDTKGRHLIRASAVPQLSVAATCSSPNHIRVG